MNPTHEGAAQTRPRMIPRRAFLVRSATGAGAIACGAVFPGCANRRAGSAAPERPQVGYTEYRTNLPGGRHPNIVTMRACLVNLDGSGRRVVAKELSHQPNSWTQFAGWSPDGRLAIIGRGWETPENGDWEEEHKDFRFLPEGWLYDMLLFDPVTSRVTNVTAVERVSFYNTGLFYWPKDPNRLGFTAVIGRDSHPFSMDLDGRNKRDLTANSKEFSYGFSASPDGQRITYHKNYQVYLANADGGQATRIETGKPFNFSPQWSPDGGWVLFLSGEHYDCHPWVVRRDGTGLRQVADRRGYSGVIEILDVPGFHGGSSDVPTWSSDGSRIYYTARQNGCLELMRTTVDGRAEQLTHSTNGALNYQPKETPDGRYLLFGSNRTGRRQLYARPTAGGEAWAFTRVPPGHGAMWPAWRPLATSPA